VKHAARWTLKLSALALLAAALGGCAPLLLGGAVLGTGLVVTDRRTTGIQIEDEGIELRAAARVRELATLGQVSLTSYNRLVLITGQVPGAAEKAAVEVAVARVENVRSVVNELSVGPSAGLGSRSGDALLSTRVKASLVDAKNVQAHAIKVTMAQGVAYLMGRVTEREANEAAEVVRSVSGVQKVVRVFELLSEQELSALGRRSASAPATPAPPAAPAAARP